MPNLCAGVRKSSSLLCYNQNLDKKDIVFIKKFIESFGNVHEVEEKLFDEMTIISGCLPAFFALFCSALQSSLSSDIDQKQAELILKETLL